jgi:hypothetical protein
MEYAQAGMPYLFFTTAKPFAVEQGKTPSTMPRTSTHQRQVAADRQCLAGEVD